MDGHERSVNIDSIIGEEGDFLEEDMKRPPIGEKMEDDMKEELEISWEQPQNLEREAKYEAKHMIESKDVDKNTGDGEGKMEMKDVEVEDKDDKKEGNEISEEPDNEDEKKDAKRVQHIKPLELKKLPIKNQFKTDDIKLGHYAIIQNDNTRYLVSVWEQSGEIFEGHYLLSREEPGPTRRYSKAFWDYSAGKIQIGGKKGKSNRIVPLTVPFTYKDVYYTFRRLEAQRIPKEIRDQWVKEYGEKEMMCNKLTVDMVNRANLNYFGDLRQKVRSRRGKNERMEL